MVTKYKVVWWGFDTQRFARHIAAWGDTVGYDTVAECLGMSQSRVKAWARGFDAGPDDKPSMGAFMKACNELSLDPRDFFTTGE
jgi:transcriptional regulator with XRE-family HTH domain